MIDYTYVNPVAATTFVREVPGPANWNLNQFLPDKPVKDIQAVFNTVTRTNRAARFRSYDAETPIGKRDSFERKAVLLPPLGEKTVIGELERLQLEAVRTGGDNTSAIQDSIYDDMTNNARAVKARMELARGDVLADGKFTLAGENGLILEADFSIQDDHLVTPAGALWNAGSGTISPLLDLQAWANKYLDDNGVLPGRFLTSRTALIALLKSAEIRTAVYGTNAGGVTTVNPGQLNFVLEAYGLPPIVTYDTVINTSADIATRPLDPKKFLLLPANAEDLGHTYWGITAEALELAGGTNPSLEYEELPGLVGVVMKEGDPVRRWTKVGAVGMPIIEDPRKIMIATVLA